MIIDYDISKINTALQDFYNATGINMDLLKADFSYVTFNHRGNECYCQSIQNTETGKKACFLSDACLLEKCKKSRKPEMHVCHAGLVDIAVPILYEDTIIGYILFGQLKADTDFTSFEKYIVDSLFLETALKEDISKTQSEISNLRALEKTIENDYVICMANSTVELFKNKGYISYIVTLDEPLVLIELSKEDFLTLTLEKTEAYRFSLFSEYN